MMKRGSPSASPRCCGASRNVVLIATLGARTDLRRVEDNLAAFDGWDCIAVGWNLTVADAFSRRVQGRCKVFVRSMWKWASLVNLTRPFIRRLQYEHICLLLDDMQLSRLKPTRQLRGTNFSFDASRLLTAASAHGLGVVSPLVVGATLKIMNPPGKPDKIRRRARGYVEYVSAIEQYATLYTRAAWECMTSLMDGEIWQGSPLWTTNDIVGWGFDRCYRTHCHQEAGGQGLVPSQIVKHTGRPGALWHGYGLQHLASKQQGRLFQWVRDRHNRSCAGYRKLITRPRTISKR